MRFQSLRDWLAWQEGLHPTAIDLGLERVRKVWRAMGARAPAPVVITVAGTNGKGSSVALLEAMLTAGGHRAGSYTSPHLLRYNERVRVRGVDVADSDLCAAFERVDRARGEVTLTYFEFGTLAALDLFSRAALDVVILEVGLGGRLDAVNIVDADVALITAIDIDHATWLGATRESIAREKAGILRAGRPAVVSDPDPPRSMVELAAALGTPLHRLGVEYSYQAGADGTHTLDSGWSWQAGSNCRATLPSPALAGRHQFQNAAGTLMVIDLLRDRLPVTDAQLREGLQAVRLGGRFEAVAGDVTTVLDVAHNPHGVRVLAETLAEQGTFSHTLAVWGMLADKDLRAAVQPLARAVDRWYVAAPAVTRAASPPAMSAALREAGVRVPIHTFPDPAAAYVTARSAAARGDRIVVFGSFHTVAAVTPLVGRGDPVAG
jgi:dihydrofolate synthase/folylpolyglutamate synthase